MEPSTIQYLTSLEAIARPLGFHVGLTGSTLYGMGAGKNDLDVIVYPHNGADPHATTAQCAEELLPGSKSLGSSYNRTVYSAVVAGRKVDLIFLS